MSVKRIIPCLDVRNGRVVKGVKFENIQDVDDPIVLARSYNHDGADEIVLYDITATKEGRNIFIDIVEKVAAEVTVPFTVGGGIRSVDDIQRVLDAGADKVSINSAAVKNEKLIAEAAEKFGSERIVLAIDTKKQAEGKWTVVISGGKTDTGMDAVQWAMRAEQLGAGEIVLNVMDTDGVKSGYSLDITGEIAEKVTIPVTASGGAGKKEHFLEVFQQTKANGALAASVFHFGEIGIRELKQYLWENGINVRSV